MPFTQDTNLGSRSESRRSKNSSKKSKNSASNESKPSTKMVLKSKGDGRLRAIYMADKKGNKHPLVLAMMVEDDDNESTESSRQSITSISEISAKSPPREPQQKKKPKEARTPPSSSTESAAPSKASSSQNSNNQQSVASRSSAPPHIVLRDGTVVLVDEPKTKKAKGPDGEMHRIRWSVDKPDVLQTSLDTTRQDTQHASNEVESITSEVDSLRPSNYTLSPGFTPHEVPGPHEEEEMFLGNQALLESPLSDLRRRTASFLSSQSSTLSPQIPEDSERMLTEEIQYFAQREISQPETVSVEPSTPREVLRIVEVEVEEEYEVFVPVQKIEYVEKIVKKPVVEWVEKIVEKPVVEYRNRYEEVEQIVEQPVHRKVHQVVNVPKDVVREVPVIETRLVEKLVEVPQIIEVPTVERIENVINVPEFIDHPVPVMVAQTLHPVFYQSDDVEEMEQIVYEPVSIPVDVYIPTGITTELRPGRSSQEARSVEVPPGHWNSLLYAMNTHLPPKLADQLPLVQLEDGTTPLVPDGTLLGCGFQSILNSQELRAPIPPVSEARLTGRSMPAPNTPREVLPREILPRGPQSAALSSASKGSKMTRAFPSGRRMAESSAETARGQGTLCGALWCC